MSGRKNAFMPLAVVEGGRRVRVVGVNGGRGLQARLATMGLVPGVEINVVWNSGRGPFVVAIKETRLMLGRGMAWRIMVR